MQKSAIRKGVKLQQTAFTGEIISDAVFWNPLPNEIYWYTPSNKREELVVI